LLPGADATAVTCVNGERSGVILLSCRACPRSSGAP